MKLLQLNVTANWGSTGKIAEGIGLAAMARGWESTIAYGRYMNPSQSQLVKVGNQFDVYAHYARARFLDGEGLGSRNATKKLVRWIDNYQPDIIQLHNIHDHWLNYPVLFDYLASVNTPVFWTFHDCWAFTGGCAHFSNAECCKWESSSCAVPCPLAHKRSHRNYVKRFEAFSKVGNRLNVITVSRWLADFVEQSMFAQMGATVNVVNNGIDVMGAFTPGAKKERMVLGVSNVWPAYKGLADFMKLREILPADAQIILVGLDNNQIKSLPSGISAIARTENVAELTALYRKAAVFVNPTYNDSFPTVNLEALACGTPVVTYRTGGSPEAIGDNTGIVVEQGNVEALADAVMTVINQADKYSVENCRSRAVKNFNRDTQFSRYIDLYDEKLRKTN